MFFVSNVHNWLKEVIHACNDNRLHPDDSIFALVLFSSLDFEFVQFFRDHKDQISSYSGENVHIFTPIIYKDIVPDSEWRMLRDDLVESGIAIGSDPSLLLFRLDGYSSRDGHHLMPEFFAAHTLNHCADLRVLVRSVVDSCVRYKGRRYDDEQRLVAELSRITQSPNLARSHAHPRFAKEIREALDQPRLFLSHASSDKAIVRRFCADLEEMGVRPWLDEREMEAGAILRDEIERTLERSDILLIFLSESAANSPWVQHELGYFVGVGKGKVIPVAIDEAGRKLASTLPATQGLLYLDISDPQTRKDAARKVIAASRKNL